MTEVAEFLTQDWLLTCSMHTNGIVLLKRDDFIPDFRAKCGT